MADLTDADLNYLRNINTRPGPGVGQSIDPTKPGPTADRIAKLKREITSCDWHINEIQADPLGVDQMALGGAIATRDRLRAELSRLRNEQYSRMCGAGDKPCPGPDGRPLCDAPSPATSPNPAGVYGTAQSPTMRDLKPSPSPGPQDVREALLKARRFIIAAKAQAEYPKGVSYPSAIAEALSVALDSLMLCLDHWRARAKPNEEGE